MSNDLTKRNDLTKPTERERQKSNDAASRLKGELMRDAIARALGEESEKIAPEGPPRVILALANFARSSWDRAKGLQRAMFEAAAGNLEMKFAFYASERADGTRRCQITTRWVSDPDDMAALIDRAGCHCGCYLDVSAVLAQAEKEAKDQPLRAVIVLGDAFHDDPDGLDEAAISATRLRRAGTQVFLLQLGDDPDTTRRLQYLAKVAGAAHFRFDSRAQEQQFAAMWAAAYAAGGEEAVKTKGGQAAALPLQHLSQAPMPIVEEHDRVRVKSRSGRDDNR